MDGKIRSWVFLYLFYGAVFFFMGLFGYWLTNNESQPAGTKQQIVENSELRRNLMAQSEEYLAKIITKIQGSLSAVSVKEPGINNSIKTNELVPVWSGRKPVKFVACFPETSDFGIVEPFLSRFHKIIKSGFAVSKEIPIEPGEPWDRRLGQILECEQPGVLIGLNITRDRFSHFPCSDSGKTGGDLHLYLAVDDHWQSIVLPRMIAAVSSQTTPFTLVKHNSGKWKLFEVVWTREPGEDLAGLFQNMDSVMKTLQEISEFGAVEKI